MEFISCTIKVEIDNCLGSGGSRGRVRGVRTPPPPPPIRPDACLRLKFLHRQDRISLFNWLFVFFFFFFLKSALHFATKLNSGDIKKCNCFGVSSYDLFASARKAVFHAPTVTGVHRLRLEICTIFVTKRKRSMFQGYIHYQQNSLIQYKGPRNYNVQLRLVGVAGGGIINPPPTVLSEPKFGPPNQKSLDPPLLGFEIT